MSKNFQKRKLYLEDVNVEIPARTQRFWKKNKSDAEGMQSKRKNDDFRFLSLQTLYMTLVQAVLLEMKVPLL